MPVTITKLAPQRRNPDVLDLHIDGELHGSVAFAAVDELRVRTGDVITEQTLARLLALDERWRAKQAALSLLAARARARGELADRLRRKGFSAESSEYAIDEVDRLGFIDDVAFAESWIRDRLRLRPRGSRALIHELARRHVAPDVAQAAVARVMGAANVTDHELCIAAAQRWVQQRPARTGEDVRRRERRLVAFLSRRGFTHASIRAATSEALKA